ncbi:MAG TPA: hypothetical protein VHC94_15010 [Nitrobacter sp.]|nr:hypothetical protein [Nitrobacter sp.]
MMTTSSGTATPKSFATGVMLVAVAFGLPTFAGAALLLKLFGSDVVVRDSHGIVPFVVMTSLFTGLMAGWLGPRYPKLFIGSYEPVFFDASLSMSDKIMRWLAEPRCQRRVLTSMLMLAMLSVMVMAKG